LIADIILLASLSIAVEGARPNEKELGHPPL
jgi:hypothetical protein